MKKVFLLMSISALSLTAADVKTPDDPKKWMKDQGDETDVYAVPLDTSEEEERLEEQELQQKQKKVPPKPKDPSLK